MPKAINVYVKRRLRLDLLNNLQLDMYHLGETARKSILTRIRKARGPDDRPAPPLKSESWKRIKKSRGLRPIRDLQGTGQMWPEKGGKRKPRLKQVGHLLDQILVRKVSDTKAVIDEPSTRAGRKKARGNRAMLMFSPANRTIVTLAAQQLLNSLKNRLVKTFSRGHK